MLCRGYRCYGDIASYQGYLTALRFTECLSIKTQICAYLTENFA